MNGYGYVRVDQLSKGSQYQIQVSNINWGRDSVRDFTVSVYGADAVEIIDEAGNRGQNTKIRTL